MVRVVVDPLVSLRVGVEFRPPQHRYLGPVDGLELEVVGGDDVIEVRRLERRRRLVRPRVWLVFGEKAHLLALGELLESFDLVRRHDAALRRVFVAHPHGVEVAEEHVVGDPVRAGCLLEDVAERERLYDHVVAQPQTLGVVAALGVQEQDWVVDAVESDGQERPRAQESVAGLELGTLGEERCQSRG